MELCKSESISSTSLNTKGIELYEKGDITILEETVEDDWYAPKLIYHKTIVFRDNESGGCYRLKQRIQRMIRVSRPHLKPFGEAGRISAEANRGLTTFGEEVFIERPDYHDNKPSKEKEVVAVRVTCRNCGGQHWTHDCQAPPKDGGGVGVKESSHYVPPAMRKDAEERRVTVKISNIPEDTDRDYLKELFKPCGRIYRVNVPRDRKTGEGRGFAFIDFNDSEGAIAAVVMMNGERIGYQVISVEFALDKEGNKLEIVIDDAARVKAQMQFAQGKAVEAKRADVYQPAPRMDDRRDRSERRDYDRRDTRDRRDHEGPRMNFSRGSRVSEPREEHKPRGEWKPTEAETSSNWREASKKSGSSPGGCGWQPRSRSEQSNAFSSRRRDSPSGKHSFGKSGGNGWGDRSKR